MKKYYLAMIATATALSGMAQKGNLAYPKTMKVDTVDVYFGERVADPYRWLEDDRSAATAKWVEAQNRVTQGYISKIPFRNALMERMKTLAGYERLGAPIKRNGKYYFSKNDGLQNQSVIYVCDKPGGEAKVFLDPNKLSDDGTVALNGLSFSPNGKYATYTISRSGSDWQEIFLIDTGTGKQLPDHIMWSKFSVTAWAGDGFYYSAYSAPEKGKELSGVNENHKVYYHKIGTTQADDVLVFENKQQPKRFYLGLTTKDGNHLFIFEDGADTGNALYVKDLRRANATLTPMATDMKYSYQIIEVMGNVAYIYTTHNAPNGKIMAVDLNNPQIENWCTVVKEGKNVLAGAEIIGKRLVLQYSKDASDHAYVYTLEGKPMHEVKLPAIGSVAFSGDRDDSECYYSFASFTTPATIYSYNIESNTAKIFNKPSVAFNPDNFTIEQVFFSSKDGTRVPMFLVYKKGLQRNGNNPTLLYGYGGFNISITPSFSPWRLPFIENGGIYAVVNLRGGSEYGEKWHQAGTKLNKQNVFDDFIAAAEYLCANNYTNPAKTAIHGGSNGGLLVGACMTQRPDLYKAVVAHVGVMDMLRYHLFTIGWNWAPDYGTSADSKEMFSYLHRYSPLHALKPGTKYPATLVMTADHDDRVVPAHSFKFAARLQECNASGEPTLIRIETKAGHGGGKPMSKQIEENADEYAFIMKNLGMTAGKKK